MQNAALARQFDQIAAYLELAGDSIFKIRAYREAASAIADYPGPIEDADLNAIEGLGSATIAKSREWFKTGKIKVLEALKAQYPAGLLEVMRVPGLGPKKVQLLWKEKNIDSIAKLQVALDADELDTLNGFGPKTRENLKTALRRLGELTSRTPLPDATGTATKILTALIERSPDAHIEIAGSLRRGAETVGNLNFVASSEDATPLLDTFAALPLFETIIARDETTVKARLHDGVEVELVVAPPVRFGTQLWFSTGSKSHIESVDAPPAFTSEREVFAHLGADYIPPELREGRDEWERARAHTLPALLETRDIRGDLHTHSNWSDGVASIRQMAQAMTDRGYAYFAVCDHSKALAMTNGLDAFRVREQAHEIAEVQADFPNLKIFRGIECDILRDGTMDLDDELLSELDFVVGSVHSAFNLPLAEQTDRIIRAIQNPHVDLIGHPTGRVLGVRPPYDVDVPALIEAAKKTGCCLEINASERLDLKDDYARIAKDAGVLLCIDTDAHSPKMIPNISFGVATARRAGCEAKHLLNTKTLADLLEWMRHR
ncbi:DNA polymerase/3'-5' exonuclease PolX [Abditibacteriota bacterium]|nr:DNA polymerase/3'-5' exonuclease PolX [Abditibacteriota bacterium]